MSRFLCIGALSIDEQVLQSQLLSAVWWSSPLNFERRETPNRGLQLYRFITVNIKMRIVGVYPNWLCTGSMGPISPPCGHAGNVKPLKNAFIVDRAVVALDHRSSEDRGGSRSGSREHRRVHGSHWHPVRLNLMCESEASVAYVLSSHHSSIIRSIPTADQVVRSYV